MPSLNAKKRQAHRFREAKALATITAPPQPLEKRTDSRTIEKMSPTASSPLVVCGDQAKLGRFMLDFARSLRDGDIVVMQGVMGSGKTTLARVLAEGLGVYRPQRVCSPTYQVAMEHPGKITMVHVDLFALAQWQSDSDGAEAGAAFSALGLHEDPRVGREGVWVVEWGEFWPDPPQSRYELKISMLPEQALQRRIEIAGYGQACQAVLATLKSDWKA